MKTKIYLTKKQTENIEEIYGLWDFCYENTEQKISIIINEGNYIDDNN